MLRHRLVRWAFIWTAALNLLCLSCKTVHGTGSGVKLAPMTAAQSLADFNTLAATFQSLYGPLSYKQQRFQFDYNTLMAQYQNKIAGSTGDADTYAAFKAFLANFHDGHVNISFYGNATGIKAYELGIFVTPIDGHVMVATVDPDDPASDQIKIGDELVAIDGVAPSSFMPTILKYETFATDLSNQHLIYLVTHRPFYIKEMIPKSDVANLSLVRPDNTPYQVTTKWIKTASFDETKLNIPTRNSVKNFSVRKMLQLFKNDQINASLVQMGGATPYFVTPQVTSAYHLTPVSLTPDFLAKYNLTATDPLPVGYTYTLNGKTLLLLRQPSYDTSHVKAEVRLNGYRAIMDRYQNYVDVLVLDQTHNPGGDGGYVEGFFQLFLNGTANNMVEHLHVDRKWVFDLQTEATAAAQAAQNSNSADFLSSTAQAVNSLSFMAKTVDTLTSTSTSITPTPYPIAGQNTIGPDLLFTWKKPMLVLIDELAGSCGDIFPMLMQSNHVAKLFGQTTMGLGGNVDDGAITLPFSRATVDVTRGLYTTFRPDGAYTDADLVENNGVSPDIAYAHTVADFRAGFVGYVQSFSNSALAQIPAGANAAQPLPADFSTPPPDAPVAPPAAAPSGPTAPTPATPPGPTGGLSHASL